LKVQPWIEHIAPKLALEQSAQSMVAYETILTLFSVLNIAAANISQQQSSTRQVFPAEI
jgi:hypothetical protein